MPASAATARTVSPAGPSLTSTASAAASSSRSTSALGVRDRRIGSSLIGHHLSFSRGYTPTSWPRPRPCCLLPFIRLPPPSLDKNYITTFYSYITSFYKEAWANEHLPPPVVDPRGPLPQRATDRGRQHDRERRTADHQPQAERLYDRPAVGR